MSSCSEDEDTGKFLSICDPNMSHLWNGDQCYKVAQINLVNTEDNHTETSINFTMLDKLTEYINKQETTKLSKWSKSKLPKKDDKENTYFMKKFSQLAGENYVIKEATVKQVNDTTDENTPTEYLLKGIEIDEYFKPFPTPKLEKISNYLNTYQNEKELIDRCKDVALSVEDILSSKYLYSQPHPKNIRYLDRYKQISKSPDGVISGTLINDYECAIKLKKKGKPKFKELTTTSEMNGHPIHGNNLTKKIRNQTKKRGPKKKKAIKS